MWASGDGGKSWAKAGRQKEDDVTHANFCIINVSSVVLLTRCRQKRITVTSAKKERTYALTPPCSSPEEHGGKNALLRVKFTRQQSGPSKKNSSLFFILDSIDITGDKGHLSFTASPLGYDFSILFLDSLSSYYPGPSISKSRYTLHPSINYCVTKVEQILHKSHAMAIRTIQHHYQS